MPLPSHWVDALFKKLTVRYGHDFLRRWEGVSIEDVKADWADELTGFVNAPESIAFGLANLPADKPPTVSQFIEICRRAPENKPKALPAPDVDPEVARAVRKAINPKSTIHPLAWAHALREREQRSPKGLTRYQRHAWREALRVDLAPASEGAAA